MGCFQSQVEEATYILPAEKKEADETTPIYDNIKCRVWLRAQPDFVYPELRQVNLDTSSLLAKPNFGIAISGGGMRAVTLAHGWMRGFHEIGVLQSARYVSSDSGGSWTTAPYCYLPTEGKDASEADQTFFGAYLSPANCTIQELEAFGPGNHLSAIANRNFEEILLGEALEILPKDITSVFMRKDNTDFWSEAVADMFFKNYHLNNKNRVPRIYGGRSGGGGGYHATGDGGLATDVGLLSELPSLGFIKVYDTCRSFEKVPFPIINASVGVRASTGFIPLEFTPMYYGIPVKYSLGSGPEGGVIGGSLIEPAGFSSSPSADTIQSIVKTKDLLLLQQQQQGQGQGDNYTSSSGRVSVVANDSFVVEIPTAEYTISVAEQAGIGSSYLAETVGKGISNEAYKFLNFPYHEYWNPDSGYKGQLRYADGGAFDNTSILSLLRRKVSKVVACLAANMRVTDDQQEDANISALGDIAALFGTMKSAKDIDGVDSFHYNLIRQVFPSDQWIPLLSALREKVAAGDAAAHRMTLPVLPNEHAGVSGNHDVDIVFVVNSLPESWVSQLPIDTQTRLKDDQKISKSEGELMDVSLIAADLNDFPFLPLNRLKYSSLLASSMSQLASYQIVSVADDIRSLLL